MYSVGSACHLHRETGIHYSNVPDKVVLLLLSCVPVRGRPDSFYFRFIRENVLLDLGGVRIKNVSSSHKRKKVVG